MKGKECVGEVVELLGLGVVGVAELELGLVLGEQLRLLALRFGLHARPPQLGNCIKVLKEKKETKEAIEGRKGGGDEMRKRKSE